MTTPCGEQAPSPRLAALNELVRQSAAHPTRTQMTRGLNSVVSALAVGSVRRKSTWRLAFAATVLLAFAGWRLGGDSVSGVWRSKSGPTTLVYRVEGGTVNAGGYLHESNNRGMKLSFSEGTELTLMPGARGRLRAVDQAGARIAIESGTALFRVVPRREAKWLVDVGPFLVTVTGTEFSVSWDASSEKFDLVLRRGHVTVSGPISGGDIALREGQRLVVNLPKAETLITDETSEGSAVLPDSTSGPQRGPSSEGEQLAREPSTAQRLPVSGSTSAPPAANKLPPRTRWADAVAAADWGRILRDAELAGIQSTLERATSEDLIALADAARYRRQMNLARDALLAIRRRFPASARSLDAVYLLGRIEESTPGHEAKSLMWYDEYLDRAPSGTYASEALGRKMIMAGKLGGGTQVRPLAEEYLRRFPQGTYAGSAKALLRAQ